MKHSYRPECVCDRCAKEKARRTTQAATNPQRILSRSTVYRRRRLRERRPIVGSAEWAETRGDDLGESPDY